jgi:hypothetical protein
MNFSDFIHKTKALSLSPSEFKTVTSIATEYITHYQAATEEFLEENSVLLPRNIFSSIYLDKNDKSLKPKYIHLGAYTVEERKTKITKNVDVFLVINAPTTTNNGVYRESVEEIYLFHDLFKNFTKHGVINTVSHEIIHAVQHYKHVSDKYNDSVTSGELPNRDYYLEPVEIEATLGGIISSLYDTFLTHLTMIKKYNKLQDKTLTLYYEKKVSQYIKSILTFIQSSPKVYDSLTSKDIPEIILSKMRFFSILSSETRMKKKYQTDLLKVVQRMQRDLKFVKSGLK